MCYTQLMLQSWNNSIFLNVRDKLLLAAMKFLYAERNGEAFDSQLVIGVRESFGESAILRYYICTCTCIYAAPNKECTCMYRFHDNKNE